MRIRKKSVKISSNSNSVNMTTQDLDMRISKTYIKIFIRKHLVISENANLTLKRKGGGGEKEIQAYHSRDGGRNIVFLGGKGGVFTIVSIIRLCFFVDSIVLVVHYSRPFPARFVSVVSVFSTVSFRWFRYFGWFRFGVSVFRVLAHVKK